MSYATLNGRTAIVTGAGQGIGLAISQALLDVGAHVVAIDREADGIQALAQNANVTAMIGDITDAGLPDSIGAKLDELGLGLDILCNNAGVARGSNALETSDEDMTRFFEINILGPFRLSRWAVARMMKQGSGAIVNTASAFGLVGVQNSSGYSISKAAVIGMTRQMATDFGPNGIRVNAVAPGLIETPLTYERIRTEAWRKTVMIDGAPLRRVGTAEEVAKAVRFLASDESSFITGEVLTVDGGWAVGRYPREEALNAPS